MSWYYKGRKYWYHNGRRYSSKIKRKKKYNKDPYKDYSIDFSVAYSLFMSKEKKSLKYKFSRKKRKAVEKRREIIKKYENSESPLAYHYITLALNASDKKILNTDF